MTMLEDTTDTGDAVALWHTVCAASRLTVDRGVSALVDGTPVAVFRLANGSLHAVSGTDPFSGATIMSRGIVGSIGGAAVVVSPMFKQRFDLSSGVCLEDAAVRLSVFEVRERAGAIQVAAG
jgi:nitrite reductase (NADH) small subunit